MDSGAYYGLNETAKYIWNLLPHHGSVSSLCKALKTKFGYADLVISY